MVDISGLTELSNGIQFFNTEARNVRFSYSKASDTFTRRVIVRCIERLTGQPKLERLYRSWADNPVAGENIFVAAMRLMQVKIDFNEAALQAVPKHGPLLIVANHPIGLVDGLAIMNLATRIRPDVKVMMNSALCQPVELREFALPIDFSGGAQARVTSALSRRAAEAWLNQGHCFVVFPAGTVSTTLKPFSGTATDSTWHEFVARLTKVDALKILPVFFVGQNSRWFQVASHVSYNLRFALMLRESARRMNSTISAKIGKVIEASNLPHAQGKKALTQALRRTTYALGGQDGLREFIWPKNVKVV